MSATQSASTELIPVLLYHRIADDRNDRFAVAPSLFVEHIGALTASGRSPITIGGLADGLRGTRRLPRRSVAITFDDGFADTPAAVGALLHQGFPSTVYVTSGTLDRPGSLSTDQLVGLSDLEDGVQLGAHTVTHPHLDALDPARVHAEIANSRRMLEQVVDRRIDTFAYPHGAFDASVRAAVIESGFSSAAAVKNALSHRRDDPWSIARYTVSDFTTAERMEQLLAGVGAPPAWNRTRLRTRAARSCRRARQRLGLDRPTMFGGSQ